MSDEEDVYNGLIESINQNEEAIKEAFKKYTKKGPAIGLKDIPALLNDIGDILEFDCDDANQFFSADNRLIPAGFNLNMLVYSQFMQVFKLWLKDEADGEGEEEEEESPASHQKALNTAQDTSFNDKKHNQKHEDNNVYSGLPQRYAKNAKLLNKLIETNKEDFQAIFYEKLHVEGQEAVVIQECYSFLQECFSLDSIEIKAHPDDQEDFFQSGNGEPKFYELAHRYFIEERGMDPDNFELEKVALTFDECFHLLDFLLRKDDNIVLENHRKADDEDAVKATLTETIEKYEKLIDESKNKVEKQILQGTVDTLKAKLKELDGQRASATPEVGKNEEAKGEKKEDRRVRVLKEIFDFYCAQQLNVGRAATFDRLDRISRTINLGTFKVILKNFKLKMSTMNLIDLYNKCSGLDENLQYDEFESLLNKVALRVDLAGEDRVHEPRPEIRKNYKPDSYKKDDSYKQWKQNDDKRREEARAEIIQKASRCYVNDTKRDEEKLEEVWKHMGLYDGSYRNKMGMVQLAFNSQDKENFRIPVGSLKYKYRKRAMEGKTATEVQQEVQRRNELRKLVKDLKTLQTSAVSRPSAQAGKSKGLVQRRRNHTTYMARQLDKAKLHPTADVTKLNLTKVETIHYHDVNKVNELFNPHDLIEENDPEDNMYLAEYNIQGEREKIKDQKQNDRRRADQYGKLKKPAQLLPNDHGIRGHSDKDIEAIIGYNPDGYADYDDRSYYYRNSQAGSQSYDMPRGVVNPKAKRTTATYVEYDPSYQHQPKQKKSAYAPPGNQYGGHDYYAPNSPSYNKALERAQQVERNLHKKQQQMINSIMSIQNNQVKKGLKVVGK